MASTVPWRLPRILLLAGRIILGLILVYAAYAKLKYPWITFAATVSAYQLLPDNAVIFVARTVPWLELVLGVWLLTGLALRWSAAAGTALLGVFFAILVHSYAKGMQIECGCFGPGGDPLTWKRLVLEVALLALGIAVTIGAFARRRAAA